MAGLVVDTDVVSYQLKADTRAAAFDALLAGKLLVISFVTLGELEYWAFANHWGAARRKRMAKHLRKFILEPFSRELCSRWAELRYQRFRLGRPIGFADAWIAATALVLGLPLVTHNAADYAHVSGLKVMTTQGD